MLNYIWLALVLVSVLLGGFNGHLDDVTRARSTGRKPRSWPSRCRWWERWPSGWGSCGWRNAPGLVQVLARALRPVMRRLFPDVPGDHPAMGAMVMNIAANMLGLGNAATPLGLRAMSDLERLNPHPGTATNAMCTFLAINTSSVQLIPATAIAILAANGAKDPTAIVGHVAFRHLLRLSGGDHGGEDCWRNCRFSRRPVSVTVVDRQADPAPTAATGRCPRRCRRAAPPIGRGGRDPCRPSCCSAAGCALARCSSAGRARCLPIRACRAPAAASIFVRMVGTVSLLAVPLMLAFFPLYAALRRIKVYEEFVEGAKEGFPGGVADHPLSGGDARRHRHVPGQRRHGPAHRRPAARRSTRIGFPADLLPMVLMRPLSGSGTQGLFTDVVTHFGPDSLLARTAGTIYGSTETTFYVRGGVLRVGGRAAHPPRHRRRADRRRHGRRRVHRSSAG